MASRVLYTARATVTGGRRNGHGRSSDGALDVQLRAPGDGGDTPAGTNPEQLLAVGYAACFESAVGSVARREHIEAGEVSIDSAVSLVTADDRAYTLAVELHVTLPGVADQQEAVRLVAAAHRVCPYSNATRGNIEVLLTANGQEVAGRAHGPGRDPRPTAMHIVPALPRGCRPAGRLALPTLAAG
jgi:lipoyl-dependent peroxiredoxin